MMRVTTLFLLCIFFVNATPYLKILEGMKEKLNIKRGFSIECESIGLECVEEGRHCTNGASLPTVCEPCVDAFDDCIASAPNATVECECIHAAVECLTQTQEPACLLVTHQIPFDPICESGECDCPAPVGEGNELICRSDSFCNSDALCQARIPLGGNCTETGPFKRGFSLSSSKCVMTSIFDTANCVDGVCTRSTPFAYANDGCVLDEDCFGNMNCTAGICIGIAPGEPCVRSDCMAGHYCQSGVCTAYAAEGESCASTQCDWNFYDCVDDVCVEIYSLPEGAECDYTYRCEIGLWCANSTCIAADALPPLCETNEECQNYFGDDSVYCECNPLEKLRRCGVYGNPSAECGPVFREANECAVLHNCTTFYSDGPTSCFARECPELDGCMSYCLLDTYPSNTATNCYDPSFTSNCARFQPTNPTGTDSPTSNNQSGGMSIFVSVSLIAPLLFVTL